MPTPRCRPLPAAVAACLSDAPAVDRSESFIDAALRERRGDRLYALSTRNGDPLRVLVLCELKSSPDQGTFPQVLGYLGAAAVRGAYLDGDSYADLAARHNVPLNTMRTWLRRSLMRLKECLEQ